MHEVMLKEIRSDDGSVSWLKAYLDKNGDLVLERYDLGGQVEEFFGDSDYESWRRVKATHVPEVLLQLIKDRFTSDVAFHDWLESKGIPDEFSSWA